MSNRRTCIEAGRVTPDYARGLCARHYQRARRHGTIAVQARRRQGSGTVDSQGYLRLPIADHPTSTAAGWTFEHRRVLFDAIGPGEHPCHWCATPVTWFAPAGATDLVVDHLDGDRLNNDRANLAPTCRPGNSGAGVPRSKVNARRAVAA